MSKTFPLFAILAAALALVGYDDLRQRSRARALEDQVTALEQALEATASSTRRAARRGRSERRPSAAGIDREARDGARPAQRGDDGSLQIVEGAEAGDEAALEARVEAELEARMGARREAFRERFRENMEAALDDYVDDAGLDDATAEELRGAVEGAFEEISALWEEQGASMQDRGAMHGEMEAIREELEAEVSDLLGDEEAEIFLESLRRR